MCSCSHYVLKIPTVSGTILTRMIVGPAILEQEGTCCFLDDPGQPAQMFSQIHLAISLGKEWFKGGGGYPLDNRLRDILWDAARHCDAVSDVEWYPRMSEFLESRFSGVCASLRAKAESISILRPSCRTLSRS